MISRWGAREDPFLGVVVGFAMALEFTAGWGFDETDVDGAEKDDDGGYGAERVTEL